MPVIQGTKKGKAKMKGSNTEKRSAGKKKGGKGAEITRSPKSGPSPCPLFRVDREQPVPEAVSGLRQLQSRGISKVLLLLAGLESAAHLPGQARGAQPACTEH